MEVEEEKSAIRVTCEIDESRQVIKRVHEVVLDGKTFLMVVKVSVANTYWTVFDWMPLLLCRRTSLSSTATLLMPSAA